MDSDILKGMTNKSPKATDASTRLPPKNIDSDAVRSGVASSPKTLGPRTA